MRKHWNVGRSGSGDGPVATLSIVVVLAACFIAGWLFSGRGSNPVWENLAYSHDLSKIWTLFTYPGAVLVEHVLWFALGLWVTYQFLGDLERKLGHWGTVAFFLAITWLGGIGYYIESLVAGGPSAVPPSLELPVEIVIFTWCLVNPTSQIMLFAIIPVATRALMWLSLAAVIIQYGWQNPLVGVFAALPALLVWPYATNRIPFLQFGYVPNLAPKQQEKKENKEFGRFMDDVKRREHERAEKERLRKLFESSLSDDDQDKKDG